MLKLFSVSSTGSSDGYGGDDNEDVSLAVTLSNDDSGNINTRTANIHLPIIIVILVFTIKGRLLARDVVLWETLPEQRGRVTLHEG